MTNMLDKSNMKIGLKRHLVTNSDLPPPVPSKEHPSIDKQAELGMTKLATLGSGEAELVPQLQQRSPMDLDPIAKLEFTYKSMDNIDDGPQRMLAARGSLGIEHQNLLAQVATNHLTSDEARSAHQSAPLKHETQSQKSIKSILKKNKDNLRSQK